MSGGPYGRGKAPARVCLPLIQWPEADRRRWLNACDASDLLNDDAGTRSGRARVSNAKAAKGYGRWLTYLSLVQPEALDEISAERVTPKRVQAYVNSLIELGNSSQTILARLQELGELAKVMDPNRDWSFINRLASKVRARHRPARDKTNLRPSNELVDLGLNLFERPRTSLGLTPRSPIATVS
jgi:integrase/recombinase XerD